MRQTPFVTVRRGAALACALTAAVCFAAGDAQAVLTGSVHDFVSGPYPSSTASFKQGGPCAPCHQPHGAFDARLWTRSLAEERGASAYRQTVDPNYIPGATVLCYDCHDNNIVADADPPLSLFGRTPQDIALNGTAVGFYETACGQMPTGAIVAPKDGSPTGGHYWKSVPGATSTYKQGDKIACSLCHDPHGIETGTNDAFFRAKTWDGGVAVLLDAYGTDLRKSKNTRVPPGADTRETGRAMCASCHGYADQGTQKTFAGTTNPVPKPTPGVIEHDRNDATSATACTDCHGHNAITGCSGCHGYPPMIALGSTEAGGKTFDRNDPVGKYVENYAGGAGAHRKHKDALSAIGATIFDCAICHGPNPGRPGTTWHNQSSGSTCNAVDQTNVDIIGMEAYWGPVSQSPSYNGTATGAFTDSAGVKFAFMAKGGPDGTAKSGRCANLTCHGNPPATTGTVFLNWTDKLVDDTTGNFAVFVDGTHTGDGAQICRWCHDATPARIGTAGAYAPNVMGDGSTWGAEVNGHSKTSGNYDADAINGGGGKVAANKECTVCHDARYTTNALPAVNTAVKTHFDIAYESSATEKRLRGTINAQAVTTTDAACVVCHQNGATGAAEGTDVSMHGNDPAGGLTPTEPAQFTRSCRQCHEVHGDNWNGATRNLHMIGKWLDSPSTGVRGTAQVGEEARVDSDAATATASITTADREVVFTSSAGAGSYDAGNNEGITPPKSLCVVCHVTLVNGHNQIGDSVARGTGHNPVGSDCTLCHNHDFDKNAATADAFAPSGCNGCHGSIAAGTNANGEPIYAGQFWPDGVSVPALPQYAYADSAPGAHYRHVEALAQQLFAETAAQVAGDADTYTKQKAICAFCHPNPGGAGHLINEPVGSPDSRVNVYLDTDDTAGDAAAADVFRKFTVGAQASGKDLSGVNGDQAYNYTTKSCANLVCHNQASSPKTTDVAPMTPGNWDTPLTTTWTASINADCSNTTCHAAGVTPAGTYTNAHAAHVLGEVDAQAYKNYACTECHANNAGNLGHGNGEIDMVFTNVGGVEATAGAGNAFYDKDASSGASAGDTAFAYKDGTYNVSCRLVYCHGADNAWNGAATAPVWDDTATFRSVAPHLSGCVDACHRVYGSPFDAGGVAQNMITTGAHQRHFAKLNNANVVQPDYGPQIDSTPNIGGKYSCAICHNSSPGQASPADCKDCHKDAPYLGGRRPTATHVDGSIQLRTVWPPAITDVGTTLALTTVCNNCHSTAAVNGVVGATQAKANWPTGAQVACLSCHNGTSPAWSSTDASITPRVQAPNVLGDDATYGAEVRGHNRTTAYPVTANPAANLACSGCHNTVGYGVAGAVIHINGSNDATYTGNRMPDTIMGITGITTASGACNACHANAASTATNKNVMMHTNGSYTPARSSSTQGPLEALFAGPECMQCHDPHGMTANGTAANIAMISGTITVVPGASPVTVPNVRFEALTGDNSFNDTLTTNVDLCVVCHVNSSNPGTPMKNAGGDGQHANIPLPSFYDSDERGRNCTGCHPHNNPKGGFMPVACNSCHSYPGLAAAPYTLSATHNIHAGDPVVTPVNNYAFRCKTCHYGNNHNESDMSVGGTWPSSLTTNVNIAFDPAKNGGTPTYAGQPARGVVAPGTSVLAPGVGGTGACALLYCHGNGTNGTDGGNIAFPTDFKNSPIVTPRWNVAADGDCGTCHKIASSTGTIGTLAHPKHVAAAQYAIGCQVCHYGTTTDGVTVPAAGMPIHVNGSVEVSFNQLADARVTTASTYSGDKVIGSVYGSCANTYCHSPGTVTAAPYTEAPAWTLDWNQTGSCGSCHGDGASAPMPAYADNSPKANKHLKHVTTNGYGCQACHYPTTTDGATITTPAKHVNGTYDVNDNPANAGTLGDFTYTAAGATCVSNCHGGHTAGALLPAWSTAGTLSCNNCHGYSAGVASAADTNNFAWDGSIQSKVAAGEYTGYGHGKSGVAKACADCHDSSQPHDRAMGAGNPYRLGAGFTCSNTDAGCHNGAVSSKVRTHSKDEMTAAGITTKRYWPWVAECVNCHDPHGDDTNRTMVQRELYDKEPFSIVAAAPPTPTVDTNQNLVFTDSATGIAAGSYAWSTEATPNYSGVCQECHEYGGSGALVSFHDGPSRGTIDGSNHPTNPGKCIDCHRHDAAFAPSGCEGCHGPSKSVCPSNPTSYQNPGKDGVQGTADDAPNVMGDGCDLQGTGLFTPKPFDNGTYGYNVNGHGRDADTNAVSHGNPINVSCTACHNISVPAGKHFDGVVDGHTPAIGNTNPFHLVPGFLVATPMPINDWSAQVTFDEYCYTSCHQAKAVGHAPHPLDGGLDPRGEIVPPYLVPTPANAMQLGTHASYDVPLASDILYDVNISWLGSFNGKPNFALCISCHNPHGTSTISPRGDRNNKMVLYRWKLPSTLCNLCH